MRLVLLFLIVVSFSSFAFGQTDRTPYPLKIFTSNDYGGYPSNYTVLSDDKGKIFFGNTGPNSGLIIFDGQNWSTHSTQKKRTIKSMVLGENDTLYVGAQNEFGFYAFDRELNYRFHSLSEQLPDSLQDFDLVFFTDKSSEYVVFNALTHFFVFQNNRFIKHFEAPRFGYSSVIDDKIWIKNNSTYYSLESSASGPRLNPIEGLEAISNRFSYGAFPLSDSTYLFAQSRSLPYRYSSQTKKLTPLSVSNTDELLRDWILEAGMLKNGRFFISTFSNKLLIYNKDGELITKIGSEDYFANQQINGVTEDNHQNIWFAMRNGIAVAKPLSSTRTYWQGQQFEGTVEDIIEYDGSIFVSTNRHIYKSTDRNSESISFKKISTLASSSYFLEEINGDLIVSSEIQGALLYDKNTETLRELIPIRVSVQFLDEIDGRNAAIASGFNTIFILHKKDSQWNAKLISDSFPVKTGLIKHDKKLSSENELFFWVGTYNHGIYSFSLDSEDYSITKPFTKLTTNISSLNSGSVSPQYLFDEMYMSTSDSLFKLISSDSASAKFTSDHSLNTLANDLDKTDLSFFDAHRPMNHWAYSENSILNITSDGKEFDVNPYPILSSFKLGPLREIITTKDGSIWVAGFEGVSRYEPQDDEDLTKTINSLASFSLSQNDSLLYHHSISQNNETPKIDYSDNDLKFTFYTDWYHPDHVPSFSWKLDGYNNSFSNWSNERTLQLSNLSAGNYTLFVRAKNIFEEQSEPYSLQFSILTPWYASWWMWIVYIGLGGFGVFGLVSWRSYSLNQKRKELENEVKDRTKEIIEQKDRIEELVQELKKIDALKSEYFANISHEFRTPLTLMLNPLEEVLKTSEVELPPQWRNKLEMVSRNTKQLKVLVDEILSLIRLESGILTLQEQPVHLYQKLNLLTSSYSSLAESRDINFEYISKLDKDIWTKLDGSKLEHILNNLISNAFKFTESGGTISVQATTNNESLTVSVTDSGQGIPESDLPYIFDRFFKASNQENNHEGLGIGLALSYQLAEFLGGNLTVESTVNEGSTFSLSLPYKVCEAPEIIPVDTKPERLIAKPFTNGSVAIKSGEKESVLIVEDNPDMQAFITSLLEQQYSVRVADNGEEGLKKLEAESFSLIISDIMMPKMDGLSFAKHIRKQSRYHSTPLIFLSARADLEDQIKGLRIGVEDYLIKPFNNEELLVRVENLLQNRRRILATIAETESESQESEYSSNATDSDEFLKKTKELIFDHISDSTYNVAQLAADVFLSERQLSRKLKSLTGFTPAEYIKEVKFHFARRLLEQKKVSTVAEAAYQIGYSKTEYFSKQFKEKFKRSPSSLI